MQNPILNNDNTPTEFGKIVAKIICTDEKVRETDRYLPTRTQEVYFAYPGGPGDIELINATYAFALNCPSEKVNNWEDLFVEACQDRLETT